MSQRGRGCCARCKAEYLNRTKPPNCSMCGFALGGTFEPSKKKVKYSPTAVEVSKSIYSVKTSTKDDRCFVTTNGTLWFCSVEGCKLKRSVQHNSAQLANFTCPHINEVESNFKQSSPIAVFKPDLERFVASESLKNSIKEITNDATSIEHVAMQVSDTVFCVYGPVTASNPLGYCHVRKSTDSSHFTCTGKDCRGFAAKGKQSKSKSMCIHISILHACQVTSSLDTPSTDFRDSANLESDASVNEEENSRELTKRLSTLRLAEKAKSLPYELPHDLLVSISKRDACTLLGVCDGWPDCFIPDVVNCELCGSLLGDPCTHPGQAQNNSCYLLTELNPFKRVGIKVKVCSSPTCSAMHQASVEKLGLFNVSDKLLVSLDILLEFREFFKKGHPIGNVISAKLLTLEAKCKEGWMPSVGEMKYVESLLYNGFYSFEMATNRNLDDVICGICGVCPEICLGDGNEKNCCTNSQVYYTKDSESRKNMIPLEEFLVCLRRRWIEKTVFTRTNDKFAVAIEEIPPIIPPGLTGNAINTEMEKRSVYLQSAQPAVSQSCRSSGRFEKCH